MHHTLTPHSLTQPTLLLTCCICPSVQFILDCVANIYDCGGAGGCMGGTAALAFEGLAARGGVPSEWTYPYISGTGTNASCR